MLQNGIIGNAYLASLNMIEFFMLFNYHRFYLRHGSGGTTHGRGKKIENKY